jgi:hypothetical protein
MTPILARCTRCESDFPLFALVEEGTGACPHCLQPLVAGDPGALLEWAAVADAAQYRLSAAVHLLQQIGGRLILDWRSVLQSLAEDAGVEPLAISRTGVSRGSGDARPGSPRWREATEPQRFRQRSLRMAWRRVGNQ